MTTTERERLRAIKDFPSLVAYLRDELDWPVDSEKFDDLTFDYTPEELGINSDAAAKIQVIKQLRPLCANQPWGIFFVEFEPKRLPVVALRRILRSLVIKKRATAGLDQQPAWRLHDLLFISAYGQGDGRQITFAHFAENSDPSDLPTLRVLGWDDADTALHLDHLHRELHNRLTWPDDPSDADAWRQNWASAFTLRHREVVTSTKQLASRLAQLAKVIRKRVNAALLIEVDTGPLRTLMGGFKKALIRDLEYNDFTDMYAQTIAYGLLSARVSRPAGLVADNLADMATITSPFLKELMGTFLTVAGRQAFMDFDELGINDVVELLRDTNIEAVLRDFGRQAQRDDPVFYFYEDFMKEYDAAKKKKRGIYFTPPPVVSFIVRSVDEILRTEFGLEDGLADTTTWKEMVERTHGLRIPQGVSPDTPFVQILDPAVGTGTFLVEVIDVVHKRLTNKWREDGLSDEQSSRKWSTYVAEDLLPRMHGFELMMAPYAIAHMKIGLKLAETGYKFETKQRVSVFLTNTLEPPMGEKAILSVSRFLAEESREADTVKSSVATTVMIGNPPYAYETQNKGPWISELIRNYYQCDGQPIGERNPKGLLVYRSLNNIAYRAALMLSLSSFIMNEDGEVSNEQTGEIRAIGGRA